MYKFSHGELKGLVIAFVVLSFSFAISSVGMNALGIISILPIVMIGVGVGFIFHELGHKFVAIKHGLEAEFKVWPLGLVIAFVSSFFGFVFASPGEVHINPDNITDELTGRISIAGPMINIALALIFIIIAGLIYPLSGYSEIFNLIFHISTVGFSVNGFLAAFNLLPVWSLDGIKVFKWNIGIWAVSFAIAAIMVLASMTIGAENMVKLLLVM